MATYTNEERAAALQLYREHGATHAARTIGCSRQQVYRWLREEMSRHTPPQKGEIEAEQRYQQALRMYGRRRWLEVSIRMLDRTLEEAKDFRGPDLTPVTWDEPPGREAQSLVTTAAIAWDKYRLEMGESTFRTERAEGGIDRELRKTIDEWRRQLGSHDDV
ncbi:MAG: helix-turn-helix domain-containing protein [Acidimicrobiia bacterium]|nr:helix-turn-helix domain-containing protein [Acidimicrobiia bacterium]